MSDQIKSGLTQEQMDQLGEWIRVRAPGGCPMCQSRAFESPMIVNAIPYRGNDIVIGPGVVVPIVIAACSNCAFMIQFSAVMVGLVPRDAK